MMETNDLNLILSLKMNYKFKLKLLGCILPLITIFSHNLIAQNRPANIPLLKGYVSDTAGVPVKNVYISVSDKFQQVLSDDKGEFNIPVSGGSELYFQKKGYLPASFNVPVNAETISVKLTSEPVDKNINVGYGEKNKSNVTSAISVIENSVLIKSPVATLENALSGWATGLTVYRNAGGEPGYDNSTFLVRGTGTFMGNTNPLVLVDGIERDFTQLDVEEVESVSILKDAAATVRYGMRGANGVILVKTKRGSIGKPEISFTSNLSLQQATAIPEFLNASEYLKLYNTALTNDNLLVPTDSYYDPSKYDGSNSKYLYPDVDWYNEILNKTAPQQQYKMSFKGGTNITKYYILLGYLNQDGLYKHENDNPKYNSNVSFKRYNIRSNLDLELTKTLNIKANIAGHVETGHMPNSGAEDIFSALSSLPPNAFSVYNKDGSLGGTPTYKNNPVGMLTRTGYKDNFKRFMQIDFTATQDLSVVLDGLSASVTGAYDLYNYVSIGKSEQYAVYQLMPDSSYLTIGKDVVIDANRQRFDSDYSYRRTIIGGLDYQKIFSLNSIAISVYYDQSRYFIRGDNPPHAHQSLNGNISYGYEGKYFSEFGFAYNGSENFAPHHRFGFFPAVSGSWIVTKENFFPENYILDFLKFRISYGLLGNDDIGLERYPYEQRYQAGNDGGYIFGLGYSNSEYAAEGRLQNEQITWEKSRNFNLGAEFHLFKRVELTVDYFINKRDDIINTREQTVQSILGQDLPYENIGSVENKGVELDAKFRGKEGNLNYYVSANTSLAKNRITYIDEALLEPYQSLIGTSIGQYLGYEYIGFYKDAADIATSPVSTLAPVQPGDLKYKDQNNDNVIDVRDKIQIGKSFVPVWNFGLTLGANYRQFDVNVLFTGVAERSVFLNNQAIWALPGNGGATAIAYGAWQQGLNETDANYPRLTTENNRNNYTSSSFWIKDGAFVRLKNIEVGYTIDFSKYNWMKIKVLRAYVSGYNLLTFDHISKYDLDPEVPDAGVTGYPMTRLYNVGLCAKF